MTSRDVFLAASLNVQVVVRFAPINRVTQAPPKPHQSAPASVFVRIGK